MKNKWENRPVVGGVPDKPRKRIKVYRTYEEREGFEYIQFVIGILNMIGVFLIVFHVGERDKFGFYSGSLLLGMVLYTISLFALCWSFYILYIKKELVNEYDESA